jgi:hypothetical protein
MFKRKWQRLKPDTHKFYGTGMPILKTLFLAHCGTSTGILGGKSRRQIWKSSYRYFFLTVSEAKPNPKYPAALQHVLEIRL